MAVHTCDGLHLQKFTLVKVCIFLCLNFATITLGKICEAVCQINMINLYFCSKSSQGSEGHTKDSNSKGVNQTSDKSYSIDNMYIQSVSLANSSPGTSWNIFGVNPRRSSANSLDKNRSPYNS